MLDIHLIPLLGVSLFSLVVMKILQKFIFWCLKLTWFYLYSSRRYLGGMGSKVATSYDRVGKSLAVVVESKAIYMIFNKKITVLLEPKFSYTLFS